MPWDLMAAIPETYYTAYGSMKNLRIEHADKIYYLNDGVITEDNDLT